MIPRIEDFKNYAAIPNLRQVANISEPLIDSVLKNITDLADVLEFKFLMDFYNDETEAQAIIDLSNERELTDEEEILLNYFRTPIAHYIAFHYSRNKSIINSGIGGVQMSAENGTRNNSIDLQCSIWNYMVERTKVIYSLLIDDNYPTTDIFKKINPLNL